MQDRPSIVVIGNFEALQATMRLKVSVMFTDETIELFHITQLSGLGKAHLANKMILQPRGPV